MFIVLCCLYCYFFQFGFNPFEFSGYTNSFNVYTVLKGYLKINSIFFLALYQVYLIFRDSVTDVLSQQYIFRKCIS